MEAYKVRAILFPILQRKKPGGRGQTNKKNLKNKTKRLRKLFKVIQLSYADFPNRENCKAAM